MRRYKSKASTSQFNTKPNTRHATGKENVKEDFVDQHDSLQIQAARANIQSLLEQCNIPYEVTPFDNDLYQECIDDAIRRGYPVDADPSVRTYLREGVIYAATAGDHLPRRPTKIWIALYTSCTIFVDDAANRFIGEMHNIYLFNDRFIGREPQGSGVLDVFADLIRQASDLYRPVASHLIITSTLNFVAASLLEHETRSMEVSLLFSLKNMLLMTTSRSRVQRNSIPLTSESCLVSQKLTRLWFSRERSP